MTLAGLGQTLFLLSIVFHSLLLYAISSSMIILNLAFSYLEERKTKGTSI